MSNRESNPKRAKHRLTVMGASAEIVGIVADVRYEPQRQQLPIAGDIYVSLRQRGTTGAYVAMRTNADPYRHLPALHKILAELDPELPLYEVKTMEEHLAGVQSYTRFITLLLSLFAGLALFLAVVGIYGTLSHRVASRRQEIGVRMALGASRKEVLRLVLREGLAVCGAGLVAGVPFAVLSTRVMRSVLYEVAPGDPVTLALAVLLLAAAAMAACAVPAFRAASVSPIVTLRR
ncbi:MAG: FtsX-like permease family protein [Acidobacteria bacterium]|nr:FtsX-like permease family protein [Acidobacteriota bacterium]